MKKLLIVDGNSILNRAFYGIRPLSTRDGLPTNAVYGFVTILKKHLDELLPDYLACAFDMRAPTFRHKMYDGYKATRHGMPDELAEQLPYAKQVAAAMGFTVTECEGWEADDILGTLAAKAEAAGGVASYILTGDKDSLQLLTRQTSVVLVKTKEDILYTPSRFTEEYGITPEQFVSVKALMGDSSDNIPGVSGIGEKTALKLIAAAGGLEQLYSGEELGGARGAARERLIAGRESAFMSLDLATISRQAPVGIEISDLEKSEDTTALRQLFSRLEFTALIKRFSLDTSEELKPAAEISEAKPWDASVRLTGISAVNIADGKLFISNGESRYYTDDLSLINRLNDGFVCHDLKRLCLLSDGLDCTKCVFDTMTAAYLLAPGESSYPLSKLTSRYLAEEYTGASDDRYTARLYPVLAEELEKCGMTGVMREVEIPLSPVLASMEKTGFLLDSRGLHGYIGQLTDMQTQLKERIYMSAGREFNINSTKQLGEVLFVELGLPALKKTKTGYSTDADTLSRLRSSNPIVADILDYREVTKLIGTYGENLIALADENGRIHTSFNQTGTATGRLSSVDPNMQNIPVRGELGRELRRYFTADGEDYILLDADYSQIELRLLAEISGDALMCKMFTEGYDIHAATAAEVFGVPEDKVTPQLRSRAKAVNFGIVYGIGDYSLSQDIGVSRKAAREYIDSYLATFPGVAAYLKSTVEAAKRDGFTTTVLGRRRPIPELASKNKNLQAFGERVAMNSPIQGSAADIIKLAMIGVHSALCSAGIDARLILQVHDELIIVSHKSCADRAAEILKREMENAYKTSVPLTAEVTRGFTWLDAK